MASRQVEQLIMQSRLAREEGDIDRAIALVKQAKALWEDESNPDLLNAPIERAGPVEDVISKPNQFMTNIIQGASLGTAPSIQRMIGDETTAKTLEAIEGQNWDRRPIETMATQMVGGLLNPIGVTSGLAASSARTVPRALGLLAGGGAAEGLTESIARDYSPMETTATTLLGAALPTTLGALTEGGRRALRASPFAPARMATERSLQRVNRLLDESGINPDDLAALPPTSTPEVIAERVARATGAQSAVDVPAGQEVGGLATATGTPREIVSRNLGQRAENAFTRIEDLSENMFGTARQGINREEADRLYAAYRGAPQLQQLPPTLERMFENTPAVKKVYPKAKNSYLNSRNREIAAGTLTPDDPAVSLSWETLHNVKMGIDDQINAALRKGKRNEAADLMSVKTSYLDELEKVNPAYREARQLYADGASLEQAQELGHLFMTKPSKTSELRTQFNRMNQAEQAQFRNGFLSGVQEKLGRVKGERPNYAKTLIGDRETIEKLRLMAPNADSFDQFVRDLRAESQAIDSNNALLKGSRTAFRDQEAQQADMMNRVRTLFQGGTAGAIAQGLVALGSAPRSRALTAEILTQSDPDTVSAILARLSQARQLPQSGVVGQAGILAPDAGSPMEYYQQGMLAGGY